MLKCEIKGLPSEKAPGPDGFTGLFYKVCWNIVKSDIMPVVSAVWSRRFSNFWKLNTAYITMVPKKMGLSKLRTSGQLASSTALQN
jgi:hypothetical protein